MTHKVGPKGQVVIPKVIRDRLGLLSGDEVSFTLSDGAVIVEPVRTGERTLRGRFKGAGLLRELERDHRRERDR